MSRVAKAGVGSPRPMQPLPGETGRSPCRLMNRSRPIRRQPQKMAWTVAWRRPAAPALRTFEVTADLSGPDNLDVRIYDHRRRRSARRALGQALALRRLGILGDSDPHSAGQEFCAVFRGRAV